MLSWHSTIPSRPDYDLLQTWSYDADGNNIYYSYQNSGMPGSSKTMTYDAEGRMVREDYDNDPQGSIDSTTTITYTCL
jgi:YD repeat-containing protein